MKILDNKRDYYDYLAGIYGIDEKVVYDRRESIRYGDFLKRVSFEVPVERKGKTFEDEINRIKVRIGFEIFEFEKEKIPEEEVPGFDRRTGYSGYVNGTNWLMPDTIDEYIGWRKWVEHPNPRKISREELEEIQEKTIKKFSSKYHQGEIFNNVSDISKAPIEIQLWQDIEHSTALTNIVRTGDVLIFNPILQEFPAVSSFISADTIWQDVYEFITVMSEKVIVDNRTDIEHLESAGFDKKTSFRKDKEQKKKKNEAHKK